MNITETEERRYWMAKMPQKIEGTGTRIRYGYLDVTQEAFDLRKEGGKRYIGCKKINGTTEIEEKIQIGVEAYKLLSLAMKNVYVEKIRYAVTDEHDNYVVNESVFPEGAYHNQPIVDGCLYTADQGIEIRYIRHTPHLPNH